MGDKKGQTPAKIRLYSIASSAVGDDETSKTVSLCVKRVVELDGKHVNREVGEDKPDKAGTGFPDNKVYRGVCSNHICDMSEGDEVLITGPTGAEMLLPTDQSSNIIMLATGTGIAPMRSYLRLLFKDKAGANADGSRKFTGLAWLFMGVPYSKSLRMMTSIRTIRRSTQISLGTTTRYLVKTRTLPAKRCTFRRRWPNTKRNSGSSCRKRTLTSTCADLRAWRRVWRSAFRRSRRRTVWCGKSLRSP